MYKVSAINTNKDRADRYGIAPRTNAQRETFKEALELQDKLIATGWTVTIEDLDTPVATEIKKTYELEAGDVLAGAENAEVVAVARVLGDDVDYAVTLRWTENGSKKIAARIETLGVTWEVLSK